ncbi:phosphoesterase [Desulfuromonas versatilis]|uniref:Phosphoesterase n=1 Tax=Desulfuromonas versatilis TaxID=2802975 RepID=A0ABN6DY00_9BACT|nr:metallophosphoesterase [Desulfuromonas versatilis]BCR04799.1 phosphoesterase [Desulfuromonas versatilis]
MVKIGVFSDTHFSSYYRAHDLIRHWLEGWLGDCDMILHAGDMVDPAILDAFAGRSVHAVRGNMDPPVAGIPDRKIIQVEGFRIGLVHGWGSPQGIEERVIKAFEGEALDCLVYGHSHQPACHYRGRLLLFNPGSPTDRRWAPFHSLGILSVGQEIRGEIIHLDEE